VVADMRDPSDLVVSMSFARAAFRSDHPISTPESR
jgi:hypothetical protein